MLRRIQPPLGFGKLCPHRVACKVNPHGFNAARLMLGMRVDSSRPLVLTEAGRHERPAAPRWDGHL